MGATPGPGPAATRSRSSVYQLSALRIVVHTALLAVTCTAFAPAGDCLRGLARTLHHAAPPPSRRAYATHPRYAATAGAVATSSASAASSAAVPLWAAYGAAASQIDAAVARAAGRNTRVEVPLADVLQNGADDGLEALILWLRGYDGVPRTLFSTPPVSASALACLAGAGAAATATDEDALWAGARALAHPNALFVGGARFDKSCVVAGGADCASVWDEFGAALYVLPLLEVRVSRVGGGRHAATLAVNVAWGDGATHATAGAAVAAAKAALAQAAGRGPDGGAARPPVPRPARTGVGRAAAREAWDAGVASVLDGIRAGDHLKVVLAREERWEYDGAGPSPLDVAAALACDREAGAYVFCLEPRLGLGFVGNTPEMLYKIEKGGAVETVAIAGTRPLGAGMATELLSSLKDNFENKIVVDHIERRLSGLAEGADAVLQAPPTRGPASVLKLQYLQHLRVPLEAKAIAGGGDGATRCAAALLAALHPTPAVCGTPTEASAARIAALEPEDRGWYAGPFGAVGRESAEVTVAIRSAVVRCDPSGSSVAAYAGAGIVDGSVAADEWAETETKLAPFARALQAPPDPRAAANANHAWAALTVDELRRCGVRTVVVCPGSRSAPLAVAAGRHPALRCVVHHDERGAGFFAVGYARATGLPCALVTSSGTAVANVLPAVVEASAAGLPLLVLTADRPPEARDTGANQVVAQPGTFAPHVRWERDMPVPTDALPASALLSDVGHAHARATSAHHPGPVHLNFPMRENLAPVEGQPARGDWRGAAAPAEALDPRFLDGAVVGGRLADWEAGTEPFTAYGAAAAAAAAGAAVPAAVVEAIDSAAYGLVVAGPASGPSERAAAAHLAAALGWPVFAETASGLRLAGGPTAVPAHDALLSEPLFRDNLRPDVVLQLGAPLVSSGLGALLAKCGARAHVLVLEGEGRWDPDATVSHRVNSRVEPFARALAALWAARGRGPPPSKLAPLAGASDAAHAALAASIDGFAPLTEPLIARTLAASPPHAGALFLSNSMPVRDVEAYATAAATDDGGPAAAAPGLLADVAANRGASGIDGILSSALGYAHGRGTRTTLLVGDMAALHDLGSLHALAASPVPLTVVVVNNGGGGIFSFLPIAAEGDVFPDLFAAAHDAEIAPVAAALGIPSVTQCRTKAEFLAALASSPSSPTLGGHVLIEALVPPPADNVAAHKVVGDAARAAARGAVLDAVSLAWTSERAVGAAAGEEGAAALPPVVLLHGFLGEGGDWAAVAKALAAETGRRCVVVDLPGHGASGPHPGAAPPPAPLHVLTSLDAGVLALERALDGLRIDACAVVGYSMGGRLAMAFAEKHPDRVAALVAVSAHPGLEGAAERRSREAADVARGASLDALDGSEAEAAAFVDAWYAAPLWGSLTSGPGFARLRGRRAAALAKPGAAARAGAACVGASVARAAPARAYLADPPHPVLLVAGAEDAKYAALHAACGGAAVEAVLVPGAGHAVVEQAPEAVAAAVAAFLADTAGAAATPAAAPAAVVSAAGAAAYRLPLRRVSEETLSRRRGAAGAAAGGGAARRGVVVTLTGADGTAHRGEAAPLPGLHAETFEEAEAQAAAVTAALAGKTVPAAAAALDGALGRWLDAAAAEALGGRAALLPSVRAGLEMAAASLLADAQGVSLGALYADALGSPRHASHVALNALVLGDADAEAAAASGCASWKVKVGGAPVEADAARVRALAGRAAGVGATLRLDANRKWTAAEAEAFFDALGPAARAAVEYVEEPLADPAGLEALHAATGVRYALDETVEEGADLGALLARSPGCAAVVLKPTVLGVERAVGAARAAAAAGVATVVSAAFESGVGLAHLAALASGLPGPPTAHGLGTWEKLDGDVLREGFGAAVARGRVDVLRAEAGLRGEVRGLDAVAVAAAVAVAGAAAGKPAAAAVREASAAPQP